MVPARHDDDDDYGCDTFFGETIGKKNLLHLPSVYGVQCLQL